MHSGKLSTRYHSKVTAQDNSPAMITCWPCSHQLTVRQDAIMTGGKNAQRPESGLGLLANDLECSRF